MEIFVTPNGKEIKIVNSPGSGHYKIMFATGGELPQELEGLFTSVHSAEKAVIRYINLQQAKAKLRTKEA
jgi:hypothetical protein